jgi:alkylhydroperoxidase family enzyme
VSVKVGVPETKLAALAAWETSPAFSSRERAALRFTTAVVRDDCEVSDADWAQLRVHFSEPEVVELAFAVGYQTFASQFAKVFQLVPQGFSGYADSSRGLRRKTPREAVERG